VSDIIGVVGSQGSSVNASVNSNSAIALAVIGNTGTGGYTLPTATTIRLGGVIIGENLNIEASGKLNVYKDNVINALGFTPPDTAISNSEILDIMSK
jgi:hypothetical protein